MKSGREFAFRYGKDTPAKVIEAGLATLTDWCEYLKPPTTQPIVTRGPHATHATLKQDAVLQYIYEHPGVTGRALSKKFHRCGGTISTKLKRLEEKGKIRRVKEGFSVRNYPIDHARGGHEQA